MAAAELPFIDEHAIELDVPRAEAWQAVSRQAESMRHSVPGPAGKLLGAEPKGGFEIGASEPPEQLELVGRHRFSRYRLAFVLDDSERGGTRVSARTFAEFPGIHGRTYRALVIGTGLHVVATRRILGSIKRRTVGAT
jgi:hypothetical protein